LVKLISLKNMFSYPKDMYLLEIYKYPLYYEIAFQYRDIEGECDFLESQLELQATASNRRILDIGGGTGMHVVEFARRGYEVHSFDIVPEMVNWIKKKCKQQGLEKVKVWIGDMTDFKQQFRYGLAINMLTTFNYLLTNEDIIHHLKAVADALDKGGLYIIELTHPRDFLGVEKSTLNQWMERRGDIVVEVDWDYEVHPVDPITQVQERLVKIEVQDGEKRRTFKMKQLNRILLPEELKALVAWSGAFEVVDIFGTYKEDIKLDKSRKSWRMIPILRKL